MPKERTAVTNDEEQLHRPGTLSDTTDQNSVASDSKLNFEDRIEFQQLRIPSAAADSRSATNDTRVTQAGTEVISANRLINGLSGSQKDLWREYQISLVDEMDNPENSKNLLDKRNAAFPDIAVHLRKASEHLGFDPSTSKLLPQLELVNTKPIMGLLDTRAKSESGMVARMLSSASRHEGSSSHRINDQARTEAVEALKKIDKPGYMEAASLRADRFCEALNHFIPKEITGADAEAVLRNPLVDAVSKNRFFQQLEKLITPGPPEATELRERAMVSVQLLHQAGKVEDVDQGSFKTCSLSSLEKRLLIREPDLLARMVTDVAMTGTTKTDGLRTVSLEKEWLKYQSPKSVIYPPLENERSLASQYIALILGNVKFQLNNEQDSTSYRFGHLGGKDVLLNYATQPPSPLYQSTVTGKIDSDPVHRFDDGKVMVEPTLQPWKKHEAHSPHANEKDILDTYTAVTGKSADNLAMMHYSQARGPVENSLKGVIEWATLSVKPRDPRLSVYRTEGEMQAQLQRAKESNNLPVIFLSPRHAATVNGYNPETKRVDYDNQWGKSQDFLGTKALTTLELFKLGATIEPQVVEPGRQFVSVEMAMEFLKDARKQYEDWCTASGVKPDSRYPTGEEFSKWSATYHSLRKTK